MNNKKMKVCHILNELLPSGAETMLVNSASKWKNCELHVLATAANIGVYAPEFKRAGYTVHHINENGFIKQHKAVCAFLKNLEPDVLHVHRESQDFYYELDAKLAVRGIRIVRTVHNVFLFSGILRFRRIMTRAFGRLIGTKYIAIGDSVFQNEKNRFLNTPYRLVNNWCDESIFGYVSEGMKEQEKNKKGLVDKMILVSVGNCSKVKNHMLLLKGINEMVSAGTINIHYYHLGQGESEREEKEYVKNNNLSDYVSFVGRTNPAPYLKLADLFVMPSLFEGVSISALEAMMCGVNCLLADVVGLQDFKSIGAKAIHYTGLSQDEFTQCLCELYKVWGERRLKNNFELSNAVRERYSMKKSVASYLEVYSN
ncbi:glycosyltransferase [Clostridium transplantifaecale]|uniref:glycosyltransferase n=1 Tax=Clostridium transplantifaecale TaxID=2479838 RepID=UPI000F642391|nr:glycosyltransferase [Clostridium transplantifaecale]